MPSKKRLIILWILHFILIIWIAIFFENTFLNDLNKKNWIFNNIGVLYILINLLFILLLFPYGLYLTIKDQKNHFLLKKKVTTLLKIIWTIILSIITIWIVFGLFIYNSKDIITDIIKWPKEVSDVFEYVYIEKYYWEKMINKELTLLIESLSDVSWWRWSGRNKIKLYLKTSWKNRQISKKKYREIYNKKISSWSKISFEYLPGTKVILSDTIE